MAETKKKIKKIYDEGMAEVFKIVGSLDATDEQIEIAEQTAEDLTSMLIAQTLETINGRTALMSGLIVELNQVINAVKTKPPYEEAMSNLTNVLTKAEKLFKIEKENLV